MLLPKDIYIRPLDITDTIDLVRIITTNREFLQPFDPIREESFFTYEFQYKHIEEMMACYKNDTTYAFAICLKEADTLLGRITLSGVVRGPFQTPSSSIS